MWTKTATATNAPLHTSSRFWLFDPSFTCSITSSSPSPSHSSLLPLPPPLIFNSVATAAKPDNERGRERGKGGDIKNKCHLSHLIPIRCIRVCVYVCMEANMLEMFVWISVYLLSVNVCVARGCPSGRAVWSRLSVHHRTVAVQRQTHRPLSVSAHVAGLLPLSISCSL